MFNNYMPQQTPMNQQPQPSNSIADAFGSIENFRKQYQQLSANLSQNGMTPQAYVQYLLDSGKMSQEQLVQLSRAANQILGRAGN